MDRLFFLGSGDAFCHDSRANQAILIEREQDSLLLDCGPTTRYRFYQTRKSLDRVKAILITHFHGDHLAGIPFCLLYWHYESKRKEPLHLIGPHGLKKAVEYLVAGTYANLLTDNRYPIHFHEFPETNQGSLDVEDFSVQGFPMKHMKESTGLRVRWKHGDIAITGDTAWNENIPILSEGTDALMMECSTYNTFLPDIHLSYQEIQEHRKKIKTKALILHHMDEEMIQMTQNPKKFREIAASDGFSMPIRSK